MRPCSAAPYHPAPQTDHKVKQREKPINTGFPAVFLGFRAFAAGVLPFRNWYIWVYFGVNVLPHVLPHLKAGVKQDKRKKI
jgi:hypothetical protein